MDQICSEGRPDLVAAEPVTLAAEVFGLERAQNVAAEFMAAMDPGEKLFYEKCTLCHIPRDPAGHTKKEWDSITQSMFPNAGVSEEQQSQILEFLYASARDA